MIQRIQTLYLLVVSILMIVTSSTSLATLTPREGDGSFLFDVFGVHTIGESATLLYTSWPLFMILAVVALSSMISIFLFRNRVLQYRISNFNSLLTIGYYIAFGVYYYSIGKDMQVAFSFHWATILPAIALVLNYLASRSIWADESAVRAADRIRPSRRR